MYGQEQVSLTATTVEFKVSQHVTTHYAGWSDGEYHCSNLRDDFIFYGRDITTNEDLPESCSGRSF
jgi:hypothetical protein